MDQETHPQGLTVSQTQKLQTVKPLVPEFRRGPHEKNKQASI
jgi:hypothetical protein